MLIPKVCVSFAIHQRRNGMRTLAMGDIHGNYKAMIQSLKRSGFDYDRDQLIQLGDVVDSHNQVFECVEELLKIKNLIPLKGNHDDWFDEFIKTDFHPYFWNHGGKGTLVSYLDHCGKSGRFFSRGSGYKTSLEPADIPKTHQTFFNSQQLYYIDEEQRCFVHAGFNRNLPFHDQRTADYYWDRTLWQDALACQSNGKEFTIKTVFKEIFIGHTPTTKSGSDKPLHAFNIWNIDTGAGQSGKVTIMDVNTKEFWQSDSICESNKKSERP